MEVEKLSDEVFKKRIGLLLTKVYVDALEELVERGIYLENQVAIRSALRRLFQFHGIEAFTDKGAKPEDDTSSE